jgi:hypothetical protein
MSVEEKPSPAEAEARKAAVRRAALFFIWISAIGIAVHGVAIMHVSFAPAYEAVQVFAYIAAGLSGRAWVFLLVLVNAIVLRRSASRVSAALCCLFSLVAGGVGLFVMWSAATVPLLAPMQIVLRILAGALTGVALIALWISAGALTATMALAHMDDGNGAADSSPAPEEVLPSESSTSSSTSSRWQLSSMLMPSGQRPPRSRTEQTENRSRPG